MADQKLSDVSVGKGILIIVASLLVTSVAMWGFTSLVLPKIKTGG